MLYSYFTIITLPLTIMHNTQHQQMLAASNRYEYKSENWQLQFLNSVRFILVKHH